MPRHHDAPVEENDVGKVLPPSNQRAFHPCGSCPATPRDARRSARRTDRSIHPVEPFGRPIRRSKKLQPQMEVLFRPPTKHKHHKHLFPFFNLFQLLRSQLMSVWSSSPSLGVKSLLNASHSSPKSPFHRAPFSLQVLSVPRSSSSITVTYPKPTTPKNPWAFITAVFRTASTLCWSSAGQKTSPTYPPFLPVLPFQGVDQVIGRLLGLGAPPRRLHAATHVDDDDYVFRSRGARRVPRPRRPRRRRRCGPTRGGRLGGGWGEVRLRWRVSWAGLRWQELE